ncbi:hypothetical protein AB0I72_26950 [Nocardiopsis sp. NPDC049922]|uniref:hypothetical protein n=1 Tax=Nocardiopsis sp. NPDC049922 TaxID=3155157 RepID=UPI0033FDC3EA
MTVRHRPRVRRWREETSQGLAWCYTVRCSCGTEFGEHYAKRLAETDKAKHLIEVRPPADQRCRDPKKHRTQPHDRCPVCADQLTLPGFEEIA